MDISSHGRDEMNLAEFPITVLADRAPRGARTLIFRVDQGQLTITGRLADGQVEVAVRDTGVGIAPEHLARITEPLYSTKARGLGLGLSIARAILDKNKGSIQVESKVGRGTTFTVRLLAATEGAS